MTEPEEILIAGCVKGEKARWDEFVQQYGSLVYHTTYKNLKMMAKVEALRQAELVLIRGNLNNDLRARRGIGGVGKLGKLRW